MLVAFHVIMRLKVARGTESLLEQETKIKLNSSSFLLWLKCIFDSFPFDNNLFMMSKLTKSVKNKQATNGCAHVIARLLCAKDIIEDTWYLISVFCFRYWITLCLLPNVAAILVIFPCYSLVIK